MPDSAKIFTTVSIQGNKNSALRIFEKLKFLQKREIPSVYNFGPTLTPFSPLMEMAKLKELIIILDEKFHPLSFPKIVKSRLTPSPFQMKNRITFCTIWAFFGRNLSEVKMLKDQNENLLWLSLEPWILRYWIYNNFGPTTFHL